MGSIYPPKVLARRWCRHVKMGKEMALTAVYSAGAGSGSSADR